MEEEQILDFRITILLLKIDVNGTNNKRSLKLFQRPFVDTSINEKTICGCGWL
jgi:hypothetical protein